QTLVRMAPGRLWFHVPSKEQMTLFIADTMRQGRSPVAASISLARTGVHANSPGVETRRSAPHHLLEFKADRQSRRHVLGRASDLPLLTSLLKFLLKSLDPIPLASHRFRRPEALERPSCALKSLRVSPRREGASPVICQPPGSLAAPVKPPRRACLASPIARREGALDARRPLACRAGRPWLRRRHCSWCWC